MTFESIKIQISFQLPGHLAGAGDYVCAGVQKRLQELWEDPNLSAKCVNLWSAVREKLQ